MRGKLAIAFSALAIMMGAVLSVGAAPTLFQAASQGVRLSAATLPAHFRLERGRGLLVRVWLNGRGPYLFAIDTGAGLNLISERLVNEARLPVSITETSTLAGLTGARGSSNREAVINQMAIGKRDNLLASKQTAVIISTLPPDVDGILDPTEVYAPYGYSIDVPNGVIEVFQGSLHGRRPSTGGAIVPWRNRPDDSRPFVKLRDGRVALLDTGSGFGLAVSNHDAVLVGSDHRTLNAATSRDIGGGSITSRRVAPTTVSIGELELRGVPTDILFGVEMDAPVILGRDALHPFKITFDPRRGLIGFEPALRNTL